MRVPGLFKLGLIGFLSLTISLKSFSDHVVTDEPVPGQRAASTHDSKKTSPSQINQDAESSEVYKQFLKEKDPNKKAYLLQAAKPEDLQNLQRQLTPPKSDSDKEFLEAVEATLQIKDFSLRQAVRFEPDTSVQKSAQAALLDVFRAKFGDEEVRRAQQAYRIEKKQQAQNETTRAEKFNPASARNLATSEMRWGSSDQPPGEKLTPESFKALVDKLGTASGEVFLRVPESLKETTALATSLNRAGLSLLNSGYIVKVNTAKNGQIDPLSILNSSGVSPYLGQLIVPAKTAETPFAEQSKGWGKGPSFEKAATGILTAVATDGRKETQRVFSSGPGKEDIVYPGSPEPRFSSKSYGGQEMEDLYQNIGDVAKTYAQGAYEALKSTKKGKEPHTAFVLADIARGWQDGQKDIHPLDQLSAASFYRTTPTQLSQTLAAPIVLGTLSAPFAQEKLRQAASDYTSYLPYMSLMTGGYPDISQFFSELAKGSSRRKSE